MALFKRVYATEERSARELYMLNIVFAIGAGIIYEDKRRTGMLTFLSFCCPFRAVYEFGKYVSAASAPLSSSRIQACDHVK